MRDQTPIGPMSDRETARVATLEGLVRARTSWEDEELQGHYLHRWLYRNQERARTTPRRLGPPKIPWTFRAERLAAVTPVTPPISGQWGRTRPGPLERASWHHSLDDDQD